jgi:hypothetical protein
MAGSIASASIQAGAVKDAANMQIKALERQRDFVFSELDPTKINAMATAADVERAKSRLALQGITDPALLQTRYEAENKLLEQVKGIGAGDAEKVAAQTTEEALAQGETGVAAQMKQRLVDQAIDELEAGASLPQDVQAELMKAGLERSGMVQGSVQPRGLAGNVARQMIGERGLALKAERQGRAVALTDAAAALEQNRNALLMSLFPNLKNLQTANMGLATGGLSAAEAALPESGLSGESIANLWLARVGATNTLAQSAADAAAKSATGQAQAWSQALGAGTQYGTRAVSGLATNLWGNKTDASGKAVAPSVWESILMS